ncbi:thrombospondin type 3 repeat-containing protein, partial [Gammaproteobacteria bacterium]|nr:thrombospondin type 3 repeat-containing protein [Gammaproteobacteria bacterium]
MEAKKWFQFIKFILISGTLFLLVSNNVFAAEIQTGQHFYAVIDNSTQQIVRRGETGANGIAFNNLILAPETNYTAWILQAATLNTGSVTFTTSNAGTQFNVPDIFIGASAAPDTDGDGLTDDGEVIMGTSATDPDSDGDGIQDGAEILQGTDPVDGRAIRTGIIGSVDTPGHATGICALNDIVAIADGVEGISVFNVFSGMRPALIAQVDTPGIATAIACDG